MDGAGEHYSSDESVDVSFVNAADNLASKSELESGTEASKFIDELTEESVRFFINSDQRPGERQLQGKAQFENDDSGEIMPNKWGSLDDLSAGLPTALIITNLPTSLFVVDEIRVIFSVKFCMMF